MKAVSVGYPGNALFPRGTNGNFIHPQVEKTFVFRWAMAVCSAPRVVLVLITVPLLAAAVLGIGVDIGPAGIEDRGTIFINISDVANGTVLNTTLTAAFPTAPDVTWLNLTNWTYPFALRGGRMGVIGQNVNRLMLFVSTGGSPLTGVSTGAGNITFVIPVDIEPLAFYDFRIGYEVHDGKIPLVLTLFQEGMKDGPAADANLTPTVIGVGEGNLMVAVIANDSLVGKTEIQTLKGAPPIIPIPANTTALATLTPTPSVAIPIQTPSVTARSAPPTSPPTTPVTTPAATTGSAPEGTSLAPFIIGFGVVIIFIAIVADYFLLKD